MNKIIVASLVFISSLSQTTWARPGGHRQEFVNGPSGCMGGKRCPGGSVGQLTVNLPDGARISAIEFDATDDFGNTRDAVLGLSADGRPILTGIQVPDSYGHLSFRLDGRETRNLTLYPTANDEVYVTNLRVYFYFRPQLEVAYGQDACIGGEKCPSGSRPSINIDLPGDAIISRIEFDAHDNFGKFHNAQLRITANGVRLSSDVAVTDYLSHYALEIDEIPGNRVTISPAVNDEALVQNIRVYYYHD